MNADCLEPQPTGSSTQRPSRPRVDPVAALVSSGVALISVKLWDAAATSGDVFVLTSGR